MNWHDSWFIDELSKRFRISKDKFREKFKANHTNLISGEINENEFWKRVGQNLESTELANQESLLGEIFRKHVSVNDPVMRLSKSLRKSGMVLGILSNTESVTYSIAEELTSLDHFQFKFLSYEMNCIKPDSKIYKQVIEKIPFSKEELLFVDDLISNVESSRKEGIEAIQYSNYENLVKELHQYEIL